MTTNEESTSGTDTIETYPNGKCTVESPRQSSLRSSLIKRDKLDSSRSRSPSRKNVTFSMRNREKKVSNVNDCLAIMKHGTEFIKLRANVRQFRRIFSLDADHSHIRWSPTNKKPHKARISVDLIRDIRVGRNTELLRGGNCAYDVQDECAFSIIYGENYECLDLVAHTPGDANIWITGLKALTSHTTITGHCEPSGSQPMATIRERWLESVFDEEDTERNGYVSEKTVVRMIRKINNRLITSRIKHAVKESEALQTADEDRGRITKEQFVEIYKDLATRPEVYFLMVRYANKDYLSCQDLKVFLETEQGMVGVDDNLCEALIEQYEPSKEAKEKNCMTVDGFTNYLLCDECCLFDMTHRYVFHEMDHPFRHYFIATSHNTYLLQDQINGTASEEGYLSALRKGCRSIELDLWNPPHGESEPVVQLSKSSVSRLSLSSALAAINQAAFERTRYPLFIRLEIHLSLEWQLVLVRSLKSVFGSRLYNPADDGIVWNKENNIPTPKRFQMKIILTGKRLLLQDTGEVSEEDEGNAATEQNRVRSTKSLKQKIRICRQLSELICPWAQSLWSEDLGMITEGPYKSGNYIISLSESNCLRMAHSFPPEFAQFAKDTLVRVIPNAARIDSSNLNPQEFWNFGVQMVALNYQTPGLMMDLQEGKFSDNGACGYILKPAVMRDDLLTPGYKLPYAPQILHLRVLSAQQLPRPRGSSAKGDSADPFVVVEVFGIPSDCAEERTKTVRNESMNPSFDESFQFQISIPELALIRFLVLDDDFIDDDFIGQYTIPFECLQNGYRHVPLLNNEGEPLKNCTLFVHVAVTNRRGGGKPKKRGMSVKRKTLKISTGMKVVGVKSVDELFNLAVSPLARSMEMRTKLEAALMEWQEQCGLGATATVRQVMRKMHTNMLTAAFNASPSIPPLTVENGSDISSRDNTVPSFAISIDEENYPVVVTYGHLPDVLQKMFSTFSDLLTICRAILTQTDELLNQLEDATKRISESYDELSNLCQSAGLRGLKATRASENFAWNVRLLKAQLTLMNSTQNEVNEIFAQVLESGCTLGVLTEKCPPGKCIHRYGLTSMC